MKFSTTLFLLGFSTALMGQPSLLLDPQQVIQQYQGASFCQQVMGELDFEDFRAQVVRMPSEQLRFERIRTTVGTQCLVTPYIYRLMQLFTNPTLEYDMLRLTFYYTFDVDNFVNLVPYMQGQVYQDRMKEFLNERNLSMRADIEGKRQLMSSYEMEKAREALLGFSSDRTRVLVARQILRSNNLTSEQIRDLVELIKLSKGKFELVKFGYSYVYDPRNYFAVYEGLRRADFQNIDAYVQNHPRNREPGYTSTRELGCTFLVSRSEFDMHQASIKDKRFSVDRLRYAKSLFNTYCFNVNELMDCLDLFTSDADRLDLAQHAYARIYDPWNYYLVGQRFRSQNYVAELFESLEQ